MFYKIILRTTFYSAYILLYYRWRYNQIYLFANKIIVIMNFCFITL